MFESALGRYEAARGRFGTGAILSIGAHALVVGAVLFFSGGKPEAKTEKDTGRIVVLAPPPLLGTPGGPTKADTPKTPKKPRQPKKVPIPPTEPPKTIENAPTPPADEPSEGPADQPGNGNGGDPNGSPDGVIGGTGPVVAPPPPPPVEQPQNTVLPFGTGMERPRLISGPAQPEYPREAMNARIEAVIIAQCVITTEGNLQECRIIKGHPFLDASVQAALAKQRYSPVVFNGRPVSVRYNLTFKFKLQ